MAKFAIACGGTGGHLFPGLAVAEGCVRRGHEVLLFVSKKEIDRKILSQHPQFPSVALSTIGWTGVGLRTPAFLLKLWNSLGESRTELKKFGAEAVVGMGGFTCAPPLHEARRLKLPTLLHESNSIPGKVTRWLSGRVDRVLLGIEDCASHLPGARTVVTGTPVRTSLVRKDPREARVALGLKPDLLTVAVMGGSQGALGLNEMMLRAVADLRGMASHMQVIHLTGPTDQGLMLANYQRAGIHAEVIPFCHEMEKVYSAADLVVARSGASSLAEISYYGLPSILIPFPEAAEDHQTRNAEVFVRKGAALLVVQDRHNGGPLAAALRPLLENAVARNGMARQAAGVMPAEATDRIIKELEDVIA